MSVAATPSFKRVTLWVRDAERALRLYRDALGLEVLEDKRVEGAAIGRMVGLDSASLRIVHLGQAGSTAGWVGLYEISATQPHALQAMASASSFPLYGQATLVFEVKNLASIVALVRELGLTILAGPSEYVKAEGSAAMPAGRYSECIFVDAEGFPVSLLGYAPLYDGALA